MRILNFGSLNLDYVYQVPHFVTPGETLAAVKQDVHPGGKGLNQSIALARAGAKVYHAGAVGRGGEPLARLLKENGVNTEYLQTVDCLQGNAVIQVTPSGENCILLYGSSNRAVTKQHVDETLKHFEKGDYLVLQNEISHIPYIIEKAAGIGMQIVLNPSPYDANLEGIDYNHISWLLINEVEGRQITGETEPEKIWKTLNSRYPSMNVVLTLGRKGAVCFTKGESIYQPIFDVKVADTTAAGDTFTGFFLAGLVGGKSVRECLRIASKASSISVSRPGASVSIPTAAEVEASEITEVKPD
jgi:ribokinase